MKNMTWSIGRKLTVGFAAVIILTIAVGATGLLALNRVKTEVETTTTVSARLETLSNLINISLLEAQQNEKEFFLRYKTKGIAKAKTEYIPNVHSQVTAVHTFAAEGAQLLAEHQAVHPQDTNEAPPSSDHDADHTHEGEAPSSSGHQADQAGFQQIEELIDHYEEHFLQAVSLIEQRGYLATGLEGQLQAKAHDLEEATAARQEQLTLDLLTLRRHEKDYLLHTDPKYIDPVAKSVVRFKQDLAATHLSPTDQARLSTLADGYLALFQQLTQVDADLATAIDHYREHIRNIEPVVAAMRTAASEDFQTSISRTNQTVSTANIVDISTLVLAVLLGFGIALILARSISRPVGQLTEAATVIADGDLSRQVQIASGDEIGVLAAAFNQMTANLRNLIGQVQQGATQVASASQQLTTAAAQAGQASQQVASTIQQVAQGTTQQTQAITEATSNIEQMARAAAGIATGAQEQAQGVQKTSVLIGDMADIVEQVGQVARSVNQANTQVTQTARHGVATVEQTSQGMDTIRARTTAAADKVKEMTTRSKEIGRIVETIDDIADKTDMLALNAAVEAARAGEHGRGFAVVADQVRKLSEDSKGATRDIADLIERVQDTVREAIGAMESTVTEVDNGARLAKDTARSLEEILQAAEAAAALAEQISGAVSQLRQKSEGVVTASEAVSAIVEENTSVAEEMAAGSQEIMQTMEGVASVAEENSASAEEVSASTEEMSAQIEEVVASAEELSALAEQLQTAVAQFQLDEAGPTQSERPGRSWEATRGSASRQRPEAVATPVDRQGNGVTNLNFK